MTVKLIDNETRDDLSGVLFIDSVFRGDTVTFRGIDYQVVSRAVDLDDRMTYLFVTKIDE